MTTNTTVQAINTTLVFTRLPRMLCIPGTGEWGWHDVRDLRTCIEDIIESQGGSNAKHLPRKAQVELWTFRPQAQFKWVTRDTKTGKLTLHEGDIDDCVFTPFPDMQVFVPSGWGINVAKAVKDFAVVSVCPPTDQGAVWGIRWSGERYHFDKKELTWQR